MKFFDNYRNKTGSKIKISSNFRDHVNKAIGLLSMNDGSLEDEEVINLFKSNGINPEDAIEIFLFLPIAFVRQLLPNLKWPNTYIEKIGDQINEIQYKETESFLIIWEETRKYFGNHPKNETILKIAGRSSEFHGINNAMLRNPKLKVEDVQLTNTVIVR
ncbi:hypothetical protein [Longitalea arenae]|uniref:hypothetical protein n=1 Tax=Longitalea arenae TaxID=2812558 RepID=UPI00196781CD|nr:hypothetical protein [Longitalea arenae]